jgi:hypothetical protein
LFKKTSYLCFLLLSISLLTHAQDKVTVVVEKANIYAEPHEQAHLIEAVTKGTVLTLFQKGIIRETWYYVRFHSQRYRGPTTGFVRAEEVEPWSETAPAETKPPAILETTQPPPAKKPETKLKVELPPPPEPETKKEPEVKAEESQSETQLPPPKAWSTPEEQLKLSERIWLATDLSFAETPVPMALKFSLPTQYPMPQDLPWRMAEIETATTQLAEGQIQESMDAQDVLKTEVYTKPTPPPPPPKKPEPSLKPATTSFSQSLQLTRSPGSFEFSLRFGPYSNFRHFEMAEPNRIVVDFLDVRDSAGFQKHQINDMGIEAIRIAMFEETTARVVFDFLEDIPAYQIQQTEEGLKLQFWTEEAAAKTQAEALPDPEPPLREPEKEPETKIEGLPAETGPLPQRAWNFPLKETALSEHVWTAREEMPTSTVLSPGLVFRLPLVLPRIQTRNWPVEPLPAPKKAEEGTPQKPEIQPPVKKPEPVKEEPKAEIKAVEKKREEEKSPEQDIPRPQVSPQVHPPYRTGPITFSLGFGTSMGGAGGFIQYNTKGGLALHAGLGMYPTTLIYSDTDWVKNEMLYSVGLKYYLPFKSLYLRPYLDVQYGGFAIEAVQVIVGIWEYQYIYQNEQKTLYGPSALVGGEVKLGALGLNLAAGVSYAATQWEWKPQDIYFSFDLSLIYSFR